jgi:hypothetical protein
MCRRSALRWRSFLPARIKRRDFTLEPDSGDHSPEVYNEVVIPGFRAMKPAPKIAITRFGAGVHSFWKAEKDLPIGIVPSVIKSWKEAVMNGYFVERS